MNDFSLNRFIFGDLDPQKRWVLQRLIFQSFFSCLAGAFFFVSSYGVMLKNLPINELPFAYLSSGLGGILLLKLFQRIQRDYGANFAQRFTIFIFCALMLLLYYLNFSEGHFIDKKIVAVLGFTFIIPFGNIFTLNISTSCFQILGIQKGKQWLAKLGAGETIAAIFAFLTAPTLIDFFGSSELFIVAGIAIIPLLFLSVLGYINTSGSKSTYSLSNKISVQSLWNIPFFRLIIVSTSISVIILYWVDYTYLISVKSIAKLNGWKTSEIVSVFFALVKSGELIGSLLSASLIKYLGTQKSLQMFSIVLIIPTLITVSLYYVFGANVVTLFFFVLSLKWFERVFRRAVDVPSNRIMLQVAKPEEKIASMKEVMAQTKEGDFLYHDFEEEMLADFVPTNPHIISLLQKQGKDIPYEVTLSNKLYNKNRLNQKDNIASERIKEAPRLYVPDSMKTQDGVKKKITI